MPLGRSHESHGSKLERNEIKNYEMQKSITRLSNHDNNVEWNMNYCWSNVIFVTWPARRAAYQCVDPLT